MPSIVFRRLWEELIGKEYLKWVTKIEIRLLKRRKGKFPRVIKGKTKLLKENKEIRKEYGVYKKKIVDLVTSHIDIEIVLLQTASFSLFGLFSPSFSSLLLFLF